MKQLFDFLIKKDVEHKRNVSMAQYTSVRIGGPADVIAFPDRSEQLVALVRYLYQNQIRHRLIGRMTNILPCDGEYQGVLVSTQRLDNWRRDGATVVAECGVLTSKLITHMAHIGYGGAEGLCGIPGTVGGMVFLNAGAYECEMADIVRSVCAYSKREDRVLTLTRDNLGFSYRNSIFKCSDMVILSAELELTPLDNDIILEEMGKIKRRRAATQPIEYPSLGSVFKRVGDLSAAQLIDRSGLKGVRVGGAMVSPKHAGFIINDKSATADDFVRLISIIKNEVKARFEVELEEEIEYI